MILLKTKRLLIRDSKITDFDYFHLLISDAKNMYYINDIQTHSETESRYNLNQAIEDITNPNRTKYFFAIETADSNEYVGQIGYTVMENTPVGKVVHAGYFILPEHQGKGYTTEALQELLRFAFEENNVYRFQTGCFADNHPSERVMQKCGLVQESYMKECTWHDGTLKDRVSYRLLKHEWHKKQKYCCDDFWLAIDKLISESKITIDRTKGSCHPKYSDFIYPVDYGYLEGTTSADGEGIDIWCGKNGDYVDAIICTIDLMKKDSEIKILIGCNEEEKRQIYAVHNDSDYMKGVLIRRNL